MFEVMEITAEEKEMILRERVEAARKAEIDECFATIQRALARIAGLNGRVTVCGGGHCYISCSSCKQSLHFDNLHVAYK